MHRRLAAALCAAAALSLSTVAGAEDADDTTADVAGEASGPDAGNQELGASLGMAAGGHVTGGGLYAGGRYLYRLSEKDWFDGGVAFTFGGGGAECFRDRQDDFICDHGFTDGFGAEVSLGIRRFLSPKQAFTPYVHGGLALRVVSFGDDGVKGVGAPLWVGAGVRARVAEKVSVGGGAILQAGFGLFNHDLGLEGQGALIVSGGVEFKLD